MSGKVVHVLSGAQWEVYVGRANPRYGLPESPWANPYKIGRDGDRAEVLELYESYVRDRFGLQRIWLAFGYPSPVLACWCAPRDGTPLMLADPASAASVPQAGSRSGFRGEVCHAQVLLRLAGELAE